MRRCLWLRLCVRMTSCLCMDGQAYHHVFFILYHHQSTNHTIIHPPYHTIIHIPYHTISPSMFHTISSSIFHTISSSTHHTIALFIHHTNHHPSTKSYHHPSPYHTIMHVQHRLLTCTHMRALASDRSSAVCMYMHARCCACEPALASPSGLAWVLCALRLPGLHLARLRE